MEARKILPLLTANSSEHPSFNVVALSLPGFGFSEGPKKKRFAMAQYAEVSMARRTNMFRMFSLYCHKVGNKLMLALGYNEYGESFILGM